MKPNPYFPGAGSAPAYIAGRDEDISRATDDLAAINCGFPARSVMYYGLRGVGKTVLLNKIEQMAQEKGILEDYIEIAERSKVSFQASLALSVFKFMQQLSTKEHVKQYIEKALGILKSFSVKYSSGDFAAEIAVDSVQGIANTGNVANDMTELLLTLGSLAKTSQKGIVLFIDEIQYMKDDDLEGIIRALHRLNQKGYPIIIYAAGLPKIAKIVGDIKSYAERIFDFVKIDSLDVAAAKLALTKPAEKMQVSYTDEAVAEIIRLTEGYPYFLQEYGKWVWYYRDDAEIIDSAIVKKAYTAFERKLDEGFFKVRYDRATGKELEFMYAMVKSGQLPCTMRKVANIMQSNQQKISGLRAQLIHKGFIYQANYGEVDFTVPQFDKYLKRMAGSQL